MLIFQGVFLSVVTMFPVFSISKISMGRSLLKRIWQKSCSSNKWTSMLCQELLEKKYPEFQVQCILGSNGVAITITHLGTFRNKCRVRHSMPVLCASLVYMYRLYSDDFSPQRTTNWCGEMLWDSSYDWMIVVFHVFCWEKQGWFSRFWVMNLWSKHLTRFLLVRNIQRYCDFGHLIGPIALPGNCSSNFQGRHRLEAIGFESWKKKPPLGVTENRVAANQKKLSKSVYVCFGSFWWQPKLYSKTKHWNKLEYLNDMC